MPPRDLSDSEASAADIVALIKQIRESSKASAIFVENITNPRLIEQIASETKLNVGGTLFSDALSTPEEGASTYIDMMHHNIDTFKKAILGSSYYRTQKSGVIIPLFSFSHSCYVITL